MGKASTATIALAASLTMLVAGCGTSGGGNNTTTNTGGTSNTPAASNNSTSSAQQPVDGGTLTMAQGTKFNDELIPSLDASLYTANVISYAFDPLMTIDKNLNYVPDIATKWTWSADKKTVDITMNPDAKWSDGQPITADDVLFTLNYLGSKTYNTTLQGQYGYAVTPILGSDKMLSGAATSFANTGGFKKISANEFTVTFQTVDAAVLFSDLSWIQPIPEHTLKSIPMKDWINSSFDKTPTVMSGPYLISQVNGEDSVEYKANPNYFLGKPHISNLIVKTVSPDVVPGLLANGQVQYVLSGLKPTDVTKLKQIPGVVVKTPPSNGFSYLGLKLKANKEFGNVQFRQALEYGLDRKSMIDGILKGLGEPINGPLPAISWAAATTTDGMNPYTYDPTKAGQILDSLGYKMGSDGYRTDSSGKDLSFTLSYSSGSPTTQAEAVAIQDGLKKIGIKIVLNTPLDFNTLAKKVETDDKSLQMWLMGWSLSLDPDPRGLWGSKDAMNFPRWVDPKSDAMIKATYNAAAFDQATRKAALVKWQLYVNQQLPYIFLWSADSVYAYSSKLQIPANDWSAVGPLNIQDWWLSQ